MQDFLRVQTQSVFTVDLVSEIYDFLEALEPELDASNVDQAIKVINTLVELVQGNTSQGNSKLLLETQIVTILERLFDTPDIAGVAATETSELRVACGILLRALTEGASGDNEARMLGVLDLNELAKDVEHSCKRAKAAKAESLPSKAVDDLEQSAYLIYMFMRKLKDTKDQQAGLQPNGEIRIDGLTEETKLAFDDTNKPAKEQNRFAACLFDDNVGVVEIVNALGELERVYFRYPRFCKLLSRSTRDKILWGVDRETPGKQQIEFVTQFAEEAYKEMAHLERLENWTLWQNLTKLHEKAHIVEVMFGLAIAQNILILLRFGYFHLHVALLEDALGVLQLGCSYGIFARYALHNSFRGWRELMYDTQLIFLTGAAIFACLGIVISPLFFSFHLLDIVNKYNALQDVFRAVTLNGTSLLLTAIFGVIVIWIYAIMGYAFLSEDFVAWDDISDGPVEMCTDLVVCWISTLSTGLRKGDLGEVMQTVPAGDPNYGSMMIYQFSYWAIVVTVLLNLIFGIIIDTFSELRSVAAATKNQMENTCFVCGIDRFTLDTKGGGFERHIKHDHNMWQYLYLMCYLWVKDPTTYNGWEQHVAKCIDAGDTSFLPRNNAIAVKELTKAEEAETRRLHDTVDHVRAEVDRFAASMEEMMHVHTSSLAAQIAELQEKQLQIEEALSPLIESSVPS